MEGPQSAARKRYPKMSPVGGRLIRQVIQLFRTSGLSLPLDSHILIAVSGGSDSVALAHLMLKYGRKLVQRSRVSLLHINHQWRGLQSDEEELFVERLGRLWGVPVIVRRIAPPHPDCSQSWEEVARTARKEVFAEEVKKLGAARIFTAHHADDLAETVLWRILTGTTDTHGGGICFQTNLEIRPFLNSRKKDIRHYLAEQGQEFHEDPTNSEDRFLRARMRKVLMPEIEKLFPKSIDRLVNLAMLAQQQNGRPSKVDSSEHPSEGQEFEVLPYAALFQSSGLHVRRKHFDAIRAKLKVDSHWRGQIHLPGGWRLSRQGAQQGLDDCWTLEKTKR